VIKKAENKKVRADELIIRSGHAPDRAKAAAMVLAGIVLANDRRIDKPSEMLPASAMIRIKGDRSSKKYVSRGGLKLEAALDHFGIDPTGMKCIDIGSSTGGFTDCLLHHGAEHIVALDAGTNQLDWKIRSDARVEARENVNARFLKEGNFEHRFDLAVVDVSFISVTKILPVIPQLLTANGRIILLIKPQFEVARHEVGTGGIVTDESLHRRTVADVEAFAASIGLKTCGVIESPILGAEGNKEFLTLYEK
jgi:23S rRNA (cytidine1920-2'-O)/16S rRNA (cytidine1409-2'-O)-methyltransferase